MQLPVEKANPESYMYLLFNKFYAPNLLRKWTRLSVVRAAIQLMALIHNV